MRFKAWRSREDAALHVVCGEGAAAFDQLPDQIRKLGPWVGSREGDVADLQPHYRAMLKEQGFVVVHRRPFEFAPTFLDKPSR